MGDVFKDDRLQSKFEKEGYVVVNFLQKKDVLSLLSSYVKLAEENKKRSNSPTKSHETEISIFNRNKDFTKAVHTEIVKCFSKSTDQLLNNYTPIMGNMVYKNPHETKDFGLHQDWRFSDETQHTAVNIWCPLVDTNVQNGTLQIVKKSHLFQENTIRGANIGDSSNKISEFIKKYFGTSFSLKAGQAIILNTQLYHFSPPNLSKAARPVALLAMMPKNAQMNFYYKDPTRNNVGNEIERYEINSEFMTSFNVDEAPKGLKKVETLQYNIEYFTENSFTDLYKKHNQTLPAGVRMKYFLTKAKNRFLK